MTADTENNSLLGDELTGGEYFVDPCEKHRFVTSPVVKKHYRNRYAAFHPT